MTEPATATKEAPAGKADAMSATWSVTSLAEAQALVLNIYGLDGVAKPLSSERDETFLFTAHDGAEFVLKIANPAEDPAALAFQDGALLHLQVNAPDVPVPRLVFTRDGRASHTLDTAEGPRIIRLLTFLRGELQYRTPGTEVQSHNVGKVLAELGLGLQDYAGRPPAGKLMWDISHTLDLANIIDYVEPQRRAQVESVLRAFEDAKPAIDGLKRRQIIHNDFNPHNILLDPASPEQVVGIIDFGDMVHAPLVNDLSVALSYNLSTDNWEARAKAFLEGFHSVRRLEVGELELVPVLSKARLAMSIIIAEWRSAHFPQNRDYIMRNHAAAWQGLLNVENFTPAGLKTLVPNIFEA
ncbi:phosphotransferase enzyme family protein [Agrobacterium vaccinii]|uniref:phosphotransferase n=1 Tax=Agrobacterium TaxID=357 RepID=UPI001E46FC2C|nr:MULTISPECIES: phosphotransferase enzyme family protein [Agrobacterium]UHS58589.1 phosphotransferase enzyme family protein [Agrobacterium vaccinii]UHS63303.1 phosphotransferase enzyme family protein [Agrobacterium vaccinii]